ncbi:hypothetical protein [Paraburkholderia domus]|uniref:hypothetical protein n=1 Tax=Paraburkholderia domus TaxID=2793075 RepID=UPI002E2A004B|nr:hypothetical protein [Paraburkholderia domus]
MIGDQRIVGKACRDETCTAEVDPVKCREATSTCFIRRARLHVLGTGKDQTRHREKTQIDHGRHGEDGKRQPVVAAGGEDRRDNERPHHRTELVTGFVNAESPSISADALRGTREHHVTRWIAYCLADAFQDDQTRCRLPAVCQRERRHRDHLDDVAKDRDRPELSCRVGDNSRDNTQAIAEELAKADDDPDDCCRCARGLEERPQNTARAFVREIGEEAEDTYQQNKAHRSPTSGAYRLICHATSQRAIARLNGRPLRSHPDEAVYVATPTSVWDNRLRSRPRAPVPPPRPQSAA